MSQNPRSILGLKQASIKVGNDADLTIIDLDKEWTVIPEKLMSKSKNSVFKGESLKGKAVYTISKGRIIFSDN